MKSERHEIGAALATLTLSVILVACAQHRDKPERTSVWKDPSKHSVQFVTVDANVELEVLDWGGAGRPIVLLAGYGNSAHVFDEFAEKLSETNRVYGITRRGFGYSSHVTSGYDVQRLAQDILNVLDSLNVQAPVLAGHSYAGKEMTVLGKRSDRIAALVYMDALSDPTYDWAEYNALRAKRPPERYPAPAPPRRESTFEEYGKWQLFAGKAPFPEGEVHAIYETTSEGKMGLQRVAPHIGEAIAAGMGKPDYASIRVPILAFAAYPIPVQEQFQDYNLKSDHDRKALEDLYVADQKYLQEFTGALQRAQPGARLIKMAGASHHIFISNEAEVLFELRAFVRRLGP